MLLHNDEASVYQHGVNNNKTFYILNPENNLTATQDMFQEFFQRWLLKWIARLTFDVSTTESMSANENNYITVSRLSVN